MTEKTIFETIPMEMHISDIIEYHRHITLLLNLPSLMSRTIIIELIRGGGEFSGKLNLFNVVKKYKGTKNKKSFYSTLTYLAHEKYIKIEKTKDRDDKSRGGRCRERISLIPKKFPNEFIEYVVKVLDGKTHI